MKKHQFPYAMMLNTFSEGGEGASSATAEGQTGVNESQVAADPFGRKGKTVPKSLFAAETKSEAEATEQAADAQESTTNDAEVQTKPQTETFEDLIKGKYKKDFDARVQDIISKRFKNQKNVGDDIKIIQPILDKLGKRYKVDGKDYKGLADKFLSDDSNYIDTAEEMGVSTEYAMKLEAESRKRIASEEENSEYKKREELNRKVSEWEKQSESIRSFVPNFNFIEEANNNPDFFRLVNSGATPEAAYKATHFDDLVPQLMQQATLNAEKKISNNVAANLARPSEAGMGNNTPTTSKVDVAHLSKQQRMELFNRALKGENIKL